MYLISILIFNTLLGLFMYFYCKMTSGICKCSKHLMGKVVVVTGANSGIGFETARDLADRGARIILGCKDDGSGIAAREKIIAATGNKDVHYRHLDLASLSSIRKFAQETIQKDKRLDILVNNAGVYGSDIETTEDGLLLGMQINYFGPFLLTNLLLPLLKLSAPSRIITVSSSIYSDAIIDIDNLNLESESKNRMNRKQMYAISKLCCILMTTELGRRLKGTGITANSLHPGVVVTNLVNDVDSKLLKFGMQVAKPFFKTPWEGAQTSIYLAVSPDVKQVTGKYFEDCRIVKVSTNQARDPELARKLWDLSEKLVKLERDN